MSYSEDIRLRLFGRIDCVPGECWVWPGKTRQLYGRIIISSKQLSAHRVAWELCNGPLSQGSVVGEAHPRRLFPEAWAHVDYKWKRASGAEHGSKTCPESIRRGSAHGNSKLTEADVVSIRESHSSGESMRSLSKRFAVSRPVISGIVKLRSWTRVN